MGLNILVVDDSSVMRSMIIKTIKLSGADIGTIYQAGNGQEGLDLLEKESVDLVLMDINMPVMDGMEMLEKVRSNPGTSDVPVMVVSTESNEQRISLFYEYGASFVHKPFTPEELGEEIDNLTSSLS
ncbi:response regulator [Balneolales bacterium ANBcel1]|nr:response regulator [Balneolales bacterium ANBcel1]